MQYRAGKREKITFEFPRNVLFQLNIFNLNYLPRGAQISFRNAGFTYEIVEPLIGTPTYFGIFKRWKNHGNN